MEIYKPSEITDYEYYYDSTSRSREIDTSVKQGIKKDLMNAVGSVVDAVVSPESLLQE